MNYSEAIEYFSEKSKKGSIYGLETMRVILAEAGNPQEMLKCIHVAGTNGKGSVIAFLDSILRKAGYKVGKYISPAVLDYREKIQINGEYISEADVARLATSVRRISEAVREATVFEQETAMAFMYFAEQKCDYVLLETGMGGDGDATNIISEPVVSVITSISRDHCRLLGDTLEEIALHKAGIIKKAGAVVALPLRESVTEVFKSRCREQQAELWISDYLKELTPIASDWSMQSFDYKEFKHVVIHLTGEYQLQNAALALETVLVLRKKGVAIADKAVYEGMKAAEWPARFACLDGGHPLFFADGAHNEDAALSLRNTLLGYFKNKRIVYIMGVLADKEYEKIIGLTSDLAEYIITITPNNSRALPADKLKEAIECCRRDGRSAVVCCTGVREAVLKAYGYAEKIESNDYIIVAFGSLSYMGELYKAMEDRKAGI